jgi:hypothetical protein
MCKQNQRTRNKIVKLKKTFFNICKIKADLDCKSVLVEVKWLKQGSIQDNTAHNDTVIYIQFTGDKIPKVIHIYIHTFHGSISLSK